jgi:hypothetical protein
LENDEDVYFGNFARDVISIIVTSYGMRIRNNITNNKQRLEMVSPEHPEKSNQIYRRNQGTQPDLVN